MFLALLLAAQQPPAIVRTPPPVFNPVPIVDTYGDWTFRPFDGYAISSTLNASGSKLGVLCGSTCVVFVNTARACKQGDSYPSLVNSSTGAMHIWLKCTIIDKLNLLSTPAEGLLMDAIESGGEIGFALPLSGGQFNVSRFSLNGAIPAIKRAVQHTKAQSDQGNDMKDLTL